MNTSRLEELLWPISNIAEHCISQDQIVIAFSVPSCSTEVRGGVAIVMCDIIGSSCPLTLKDLNYGMAPYEYSYLYVY